MPEASCNSQDTVDVVRQVVAYANKYAFVTDAVMLGPCYTRLKNRNFMNEHSYIEQDIFAMLEDLTIEEYCHTSKEAGEQDAYVFGVYDCSTDILIYLKFQILDGIIVISFHDPDRNLDFPYKKEQNHESIL